MLLTWLLVLALGSGAVAQAPSPEATPQPIALYAPNDLSAALPAQVGGLGLDVEWAGFTYADTREEAFWQDLLGRLGKDGDDVRAAGGQYALPPGLGPGALPLTVSAMRIDGIRAGAWAGYYMDAALGALDFESQLDYETAWRIIGGRDVYAVVLTPEATAELQASDAALRMPEDAGIWAYPVGEVLFVVAMPFDWPEDAPTVEDVLAEWP